MKGFIPSNFLVQSSMLIFEVGFVGGTLLGEVLTLRRENADAKRRSSTGGGVFGTSFDSVSGVVELEDDRVCDDFRRAGPLAKRGGALDVFVVDFANPPPNPFVSAALGGNLNPSLANPVLFVSKANPAVWGAGFGFDGDRISSLTPVNT